MLRTLMMVASLSIGFLDAWGVGDHDYRLAASLGDHERTRGLLHEAVQHFDAAVADGSEPRSYLAYGNTLYLTGRRAEAIAMFRRGLSHRPGDSLLRKQLSIAESELAGVDNPMPMSFATPWISGNLVSTLSAILVLAAAVSWALGRRLNRPRLGLVGVFGTCAILIGLLAVYVVQNDSRRTFAEVQTVRQETPLRVGNGASFDAIPQTPPLRPGQAVHVLGTRGGWSHVECPDEKTGWLKNDVLIR
jgi:hypothetical protein